ncbi:MAG: hypothetical protein WC284_09260 [Candidimonas sp.]
MNESIPSWILSADVSAMKLAVNEPIWLKYAFSWDMVEYGYHDWEAQSISGIRDIDGFANMIELAESYCPVHASWIKQSVISVPTHVPFVVRQLENNLFVTYRPDIQCSVECSKYKIFGSLGLLGHISPQTDMVVMTALRFETIVPLTRVSEMTFTFMATEESFIINGTPYPHNLS